MSGAEGPAAEVWPQIDYPAWRETSVALHLYMQIVGKYRLAHTPWLSHSWHATFYVEARGFTSSLIPDGPGLEFSFDCLAHRLIGRSGNGTVAEMPLGATTVAAFHERFCTLVRELGGNPTFDGRPNEVPDPKPFAEDFAERPYDGAAVTRFFQANLAIDRAFKEFRTSFLGKCSPVHLFWGSFDMAVTRFSGRRAPRHPGGVAALPDAVTREAYDHEVSSAGFWPGEGIGYPAFYSYAYPGPAGFAEAAVEPAEAFWNAAMGEFILPYEAVRTASDPKAALLAFLESTYTAAASLAEWDRDALECSIGIRGTPRAAV